MQHRGRRDADLGGPGSRALRKSKSAPWIGWNGERALDMHGRRLEADLAAVVLAEFGGKFAIGNGDARQLLEKVDMKIGAAELAVGNALEADILLRAHDFANAFVLDRAQRSRLDLAGEKGFARVGQAPRTQVAADVVGAKWRSIDHKFLPQGCCRPF